MTFLNISKTATMFAAVATVLLMGASTAAARPDVRTMTCAQAKDAARQNGAIVMSTGTHTYQRFVGGRGFCDPHEEVVSAWVKTKDNNRCSMLICKNRERW